MSESPPNVIVLAGPNGAGKTTAARTLLAETLKVMTYVNADVIAQGLAGFDPDSAAIEASRIMLARLHKLAEQRADFAFETTLAGRSYVPWIKGILNQGYTVNLLYFWLESPDLAVARVAERVRLGGHGIPEATIRQRYDRSLRNLFSLYRPIVTSWEIFNNTGSNSHQVAVGDEKTETILIEAIWRQMHRVIQ